MTYEGYYGELKYGYRSDTGWITETVDRDDAGALGSVNSLVLDSANRPHILYGGRTGGPAEGGYRWTSKYAYYDGTAWRIQKLNSIGTGSFVLDSENQPHIVSIEETGTSLEHAYFDGTAWITETVDSSHNPLYAPSAAIDASGHLHVSYLEILGERRGILKYARSNGTGWTVSTVDSSGTLFGGSSLALDVFGLPYIAYSDEIQHTLKYTFYDNTTWHMEVVDNVGDVSAGFFLGTQYKWLCPYQLPWLRQSWSQVCSYRPVVSTTENRGASRPWCTCFGNCVRWDRYNSTHT
jgi:hypothetical protein